MRFGIRCWLVAGLVLTAACGTRVESGAGSGPLLPGRAGVTSTRSAKDAPLGRSAGGTGSVGQSESAGPSPVDHPPTTARPPAGTAPRSVRSENPAGGPSNAARVVPAPDQGSAERPRPPLTQTNGQAEIPVAAVQAPVVIASVGTLSGPGGAVLGGIVKGAQAWVKHANQAGGLAGHPVAFVVFDDGADPARHQAQVKEAVERHHAVAFLANVEVLTGQSSVKYLGTVRVPVIGTDTATPWALDSPVYFPQASTGDAASYGVFAGIAQQLVGQGKTKLGTVVCTEAQFCTDSDRVFARYAESVGFDQVYRAKTSLAQPDFTAECLSARNAGAEVFLVFLDSASVSRVAASCARQGYRPTFATASGLVAERHRQDPNLAGLVAGTNVFPSFQRGTPATEEYQAAWRSFGQGAIGEGPPLGWTAGKLLERAVAGLTGPLTSEAVLRGLATVKNDTLGGLTAPLTFGENHPAPPPCWFTILVRDGQWVSPDGFQSHCRPTLEGTS